MDELIPVFKPHIGIETAKAAVEALDLGWLGMGSYVGEFERGLESYLGLSDGVSWPSIPAPQPCTWPCW